MPSDTTFGSLQQYAHRTIAGGVGHNLPQEAPQTFTDAVIEVDGFGSQVP
jgi:hypothetical protein